MPGSAAEARDAAEKGEMFGLVRLPSAAMPSSQDAAEGDADSLAGSSERDFMSNHGVESPFKRFAQLAMTPTTRVIMNVARVQRREAQLRMRAPKGVALVLMLVAHGLLIPAVFLPLLKWVRSDGTIMTVYLSDIMEGLEQTDPLAHLGGLIAACGTGVIIGRMLLWSFGLWFGNQGWLAFARDLSPWVCMLAAALSSVTTALPEEVIPTNGYRCVSLYCVLSVIASVLSCPPLPGFSHSTLGPRKLSRIFFCLSTASLAVALAVLMAKDIICVGVGKMGSPVAPLRACFSLFEIVSADHIAWGGWLSLCRLGAVWLTFLELSLWVMVTAWPPLRPRIRRPLLMLRYGVIFEPVVVMVLLVWAAPAGDAKIKVTVISATLFGLASIAALLQVVRWRGMRYLKDYTNQLSPTRDGQPFDFEMGTGLADDTGNDANGWTVTENVDEFGLPPSDMQETLARYAKQGNDSRAPRTEASTRPNASAE
ncbi:Palmitoyltransferase zdhhc14 [Perkinsus olseni]|uniref:Palmitoyltransferase zdhhc14 n=1 Tax=Perkinsus olseni TaxID=32597 RepID=A0A7J6TY21_PEROL|nr:Palmitoyltransferase zdhhc14 [Perkinsus olseni]